jgi:hypothetical protein
MVRFVAFAPCDWKAMGKGRTTRPIHGDAFSWELMTIGLLAEEQSKKA